MEPMEPFRWEGYGVRTSWAFRRHGEEGMLWELSRAGWGAIFKTWYLVLEREGGCGEEVREERLEDRGRSTRGAGGLWPLAIVDMVEGE